MLNIVGTILKEWQEQLKVGLLGMLIFYALYKASELDSIIVIW